ncbi:hypothetical protein [Streptomyces sp. NL15-2K]|uniref:hypothetical protein n=1 Tax=Streptomyces sp. NL15-2K TaxID=376149 RepID=UPI000F566BEA|nr:MULTISPECIES: hypothetical protein [Actinomycetes]WKX12573.1 hypothetical protein Q4V64_35640 [Kutzneria buriramensis]
MPTHALRALADPRRPRPFDALLRAVLLMAIGLCALVHGPSEETDRPAPAVPAAVASVAGEGVPHGPHRHHQGEECALDGAVRTTAQAAQQPPADAAAMALVGVLPLPAGPPAHRRPYRFRRRHTGRTALVRTSRWRI